jgi:fructokinase
MTAPRDVPAGRITCLGEALVDFLPIEDEGHTVGFRMHAGGSLLNVAVAAARLGQPVALAGKLGTDFFGRYLRTYLEREGVDLRWLSGADAPSALAFVALESGEPTFAFYGDGAADTRLRIGELPDALFDETAILHVGSISLLRGTTPEAVLAACQRLAGRALLSLDPNLRPTLVAEPATYRALLGSLLGLVDVVKVSAADIAWLAPGRGIENAAGELLAAGPELVVVTCGADGVLAMRSARERGGPAAVCRAPAYPVDVVDTVGAGDAFDAGLLTWLAERGITSRKALRGLAPDGLTAALRFAAAVAALNCTRAGADPPDRRSVREFLSTTDSSIQSAHGAASDP